MRKGRLWIIKFYNGSAYVRSILKLCVPPHPVVTSYLSEARPSPFMACYIYCRLQHSSHAIVVNAEVVGFVVVSVAVFVGMPSSLLRIHFQDRSGSEFFSDPNFYGSELSSIDSCKSATRIIIHQKFYKIV